MLPNCEILLGKKLPALNYSSLLICCKNYEHLSTILDKVSKFVVLNTNPGLAREHHNLKGECISVLVSALQTDVLSLDELDADILGKVQSMANSTETSYDEVRNAYE